jgi:hypothetical protein
VLAEQPLPAAKYDRNRHQDQSIDQACGEQLRIERTAALDNQIGSIAILEPSNCFDTLEPFSLLVAQLAYEGSDGPELAYRFERYSNHAR